jgi:uncharacterized protein
MVGFCVGVTGVGGGSLMTPILISLFRIEPHIAIGTDLLYAAISKFCGSFVHAKKMNIVWPIVIWLAVGSIPASFATHWVLDNYLSQSTHYKAVLTMVLGFMLTITGLSILFRSQIEYLFNKYRKQELPDMTQDLEKVIQELIQSAATPENLAAEIEKLMDIEAAQIQVMQHITMHKQLLSGNSEDPVTAVLALVQ